MRIIAGKFKKSNLFSVPGNTARPTTDYVREVIYSVLGDMSELAVLDLYAGSGALGLEALSRGCNFVDFVEFSEKSIRTIIRNLEKLHCTEQCKISRKKVSSFLKTCPKQFNVILVDPPYERKLVNKTISMILENELILPTGRIVIEHSNNEKLDTQFRPYISFEKNTGRTTLTILTIE